MDPPLLRAFLVSVLLPCCLFGWPEIEMFRWKCRLSIRVGHFRPYVGSCVSWRHTMNLYRRSFRRPDFCVYFNAYRADNVLSIVLQGDSKRLCSLLHVPSVADNVLTCTTGWLKSCSVRISSGRWCSRVHYTMILKMSTLPRVPWAAIYVRLLKPFRYIVFGILRSAVDRRTLRSASFGVLHLSGYSFNFSPTALARFNS